MLLGVIPFASFAAEPVYDRAEIAAENEAYIDGMSAEQIASLILDWVDREVAKYSEDIKAAVVEGVVENGFEGFELAAFGDVIAAQIPDIASLDDIIAYKDYLKELGGDFANLDAAKLVTRAEAGSAIGFINGVFEFMAANSDIFGKVFRWDDKVFDYGKVGEYIETLKDSENADEQAIYEFYINYLLGNDIQGKFTKWVADQMNYTIPAGETFDDTLNNGILGWFVNLCETNGILSADAIAELKTYDLRTTDVYTLIKNFVALAEADNEVEIDTYYNYIMDTVVRTMLKTMLGQKAVVGAAANLPASFAETYKDYALLAQISGGTGVDASGAKELYEFIDTDFAVDQGLLDFTANYDKYNGVVGQANRVLYDLVDMLVSDAGMEKLALTEGNNDNFTANLEKICETAEDMMASAEAIMTDPEINGLLGDIGLDMDSLLAGMDLDLLYAVDFSSVEALWVSVITLGLDIIDNGSNELIAEVHALIGDLANLDAMAVAVADYALGECVPALNTALADAGLDFALTVPAKTDAKAVADGAGKDIIMTKAVDLIYEAAVEGVALVNSIANEALAALATEAGIEMPTVAFKLDIAKGADWEATLTALVNRAYELLDGIVIACDNEYTDTIDKISAVANAILPLGSLASNCASDNFAFDGNKVMGFLFDDGLEGDLDGFLRLFETKEKTADVAANVSVTEALISASDHIVDSIFPDTVEAELYVNATSEKFTETTVQEYFTSAENDQAIASRNMKSINGRKADLVPAVLNIAREAGVLPFFAKCDQDHTAADLETVTVPGKAATCTEAGVEDAVKCAECGYVVSGGNEIPATDHDYESKVTTAPTCDKEGVRTYTCKNDATHVYTEKNAAIGHSYGAWEVTKAPTCAETGVETRTCHCGDEETREIAKTAHVDSDSDNECDNCGKEIDSSFGAKIKAFFQKIINWFKNLFKF